MILEGKCLVWDSAASRRMALDSAHILMEDMKAADWGVGVAAA